MEAYQKLLNLHLNWGKAIEMRHKKQVYGGGDRVGNVWPLLSEEPRETLSCKSVKDIWFNSPFNSKGLFSLNPRIKVTFFKEGIIIFNQFSFNVCTFTC